VTGFSTKPITHAKGPLLVSYPHLYFQHIRICPLHVETVSSITTPNTRNGMVTEDKKINVTATIIIIIIMLMLVVVCLMLRHKPLIYKKY
jgi:hypothetical protein